jgi:CRISPR-associated protein Cas1
MGTDPTTTVAPAIPGGELPRAKFLRPGDRSGPEPDPVLPPARMINEVLYCERLAALEWVHGEFADNHFTVDGRHVHRRVDKPGAALACPQADAASAAASAGSADGETVGDGGADARPSEDAEPTVARSVWLGSEKLGFSAKIDLVELDGEGVRPIDYKRGKVPNVPEGAYLPERAQVAAQVLLLREHGYPATDGLLYFAASKRRVPVIVDDDLEAIVRGAVARLRELATQPELPPPLVDSPKCHGCSLSPICLPDEVELLKRLDDAGRDAVAEMPGEEGGDDRPDGLRRRLIPARDDREPLYVQEPGARIRLDAERLMVVPRDSAGKPGAVRLPNTSQVCLFGGVQISTQAVQALLEREIPLLYFTGGGYFLGRTIGNGSNDVHLRMAQHRLAEDPERSLDLARGVVASKIRNCRTLLRRNHTEPGDVLLGHLEQLAKKAESAGAVETLLGIEGAAGRAYFESFAGMLKGPEERLRAFDFEKRNRRPPVDRINALLSFSYALLAKELTVAIASVGLDPLVGFYHRPRFGRPGLALDLMEEMRPLLADSTVIGLVNTGAIDPDDFLVHAGASVGLKPSGRKRVIAAFERRLSQQVTHPVFGYRVSYRRILEVQARLLARLLLGDIDALPPFRVR